MIPKSANRLSETIMLPPRMGGEPDSPQLNQAVDNPLFIVPVEDGPAGNPFPAFGITP